MKDAVTLLRELRPHLDKLVCYASTPGEYEPNRIVKDVEEFLDATPTAYTVFEDAVARNDAQQVLVTWQDVKAVMDKYLHVGQITSPQGDGSRPYAVFSKRDAAVAVAQLVNDRFNAKRAK